MLTAGQPEDTHTFPVKLGVSYEGGDPTLLERVLPLVDYVEVTPETIAELDAGVVHIRQDIIDELRNAQAAVKFIVHGVGLSIGSHEGWSDTYFLLLDTILEKLDVEWHSEHLGYTKVDDQHLGIMMAMPKTDESLDMLCERIRLIRDRYRMPFLIENIVHVVPDFPAKYSDAAFLNALARRADCGLIVDVYNLECDAHNHGFDIPGFLVELDASNVRELHLACGVEHNGFLLDVHSQLTREFTIECAKEVIRRSAGASEVAVYEFMPEAVPGLGYEAIERELRRLGSAFGR